MLQLQMTKKIICTLAAATTLVGFSLPLLSGTAVAQPKASWCWCTDYVAKKFNLKGYPVARNWNDGYLQKNKFTQTQSPKSGDIVVMEAGFTWADSKSGHVALFESMDSKGFITVRGANNGGKIASTDAGCNNVTSLLYKDKAGTASVINNKKVSFWTNRP